MHRRNVRRQGVGQGDDPIGQIGDGDAAEAVAFLDGTRVPCTQSEAEAGGYQLVSGGGVRGAQDAMGRKAQLPAEHFGVGHQRLWGVDHGIVFKIAQGQVFFVVQGVLRADADHAGQNGTMLADQVFLKGEAAQSIDLGIAGMKYVHVQVAFKVGHPFRGGLALAVDDGKLVLLAQGQLLIAALTGQLGVDVGKGRPDARFDAHGSLSLSGLENELLMLADQAGVLQHLGTLTGGDGTLPASVEHGKAQLLFQRADGVADAGVGDEQIFGCLRNGAYAVHFQNILQLLDGHGITSFGQIIANSGRTGKRHGGK